MPQSFVERRLATIAGLIRQLVCPSTWTAYDQVWREWNKLVSSVGGCFQEEDRLHVLLYFIGKNFEEGVAISSLNRKIVGLAFLFRLSGLADATKSFFG